jgi:phosphatidylserine/phosphatidylglycerophosphate/cardiolipin synthase-like enzyme
VSFVRAELQVSKEWRGREYTTDPPRYVPYTVWTLGFELTCELPFRVVCLLEHGNVVRWGLRGLAEGSLEVSARFHPNNWLRSSDVHISFGPSTWVTDELLKQDPRTEVQLLEPEAATGEVARLAQLPRHDITLSVIGFVVDDTEDRRLDKWRVHPDLKPHLPPHLEALTSGRQSGEITR